MVSTKSPNVSLERSQPVPPFTLSTPSSTVNGPPLTISQPSRLRPLNSAVAGLSWLRQRSAAEQ